MPASWTTARSPSRVPLPFPLAFQTPLQIGARLVSQIAPRESCVSRGVAGIAVLRLDVTAHDRAADQPLDQVKHLAERHTLPTADIVGEFAGPAREARDGGCDRVLDEGEVPRLGPIAVDRHWLSAPPRLEETMKPHVGPLPRTVHRE